MPRNVTRSLLVLAMAIGLVWGAASCNASSDAPPASEAGPPGEVDGGTPPESSLGGDGGSSLEVTVHAVIDLPRNASTQALSATAFDEGSRTLFALQDTGPRIVPLVGNTDFTSFSVGTALDLTGRPNAAWDGEGLVRVNGGYIAVTHETTPTVERFDGTGAFSAAVSLPARFANQAPGNKGLESLALSPSGRFLFTANESALTSDGSAATKTRGTTVRILRRELSAPANADIELAYRTEPLGAGGTGDMGVVGSSRVDLQACKLEYSIVSPK